MQFPPFGGMVEWIGVASRVMSPPWGFVLLVGGSQGCVALLLTLGFISVHLWCWGATATFGRGWLEDIIVLPYLEVFLSCWHQC